MMFLSSNKLCIEPSMAKGYNSEALSENQTHSILKELSSSLHYNIFIYLFKWNILEKWHYLKKWQIKFKL